MITTGSVPKALFGAKKPAVATDKATAGDAMRYGTPQALRTTSKHKQMVSAALELKRESGGHRSDPTAYRTGKRQKLAFPPKGQS